MNKKATRKQLIECIKGLLRKDWECAWDGREGKDPSAVALDILAAEKLTKEIKS